MTKPWSLREKLQQRGVQEAVLSQWFDNATGELTGHERVLTHVAPDDVVRMYAALVLGPDNNLHALFEANRVSDVSAFISAMNGLIEFPENVFSWLEDVPSDEPFPFGANPDPACPGSPFSINNNDRDVWILNCFVSGNLRSDGPRAQAVADITRNLLSKFGGVGLWFHATSHDGAHSITSMINLSASTRRTDFGPPSFYLSPDLNDALLWAASMHSSQPALVIFDGNAAMREAEALGRYCRKVFDAPDA